MSSGTLAVYAAFINTGPKRQLESRECLVGGIAPHDDNILPSRNENYSLLPMDIKA